MAGKIYDVTIPRTYKDANGKEKTHFWNVGTAFPLRERDGFSIKLNARMLVTDEYVVFVREPRDGASDDQPPDEHDQIPF
jgi:hypothetical protein